MTYEKKQNPTYLLENCNKALQILALYYNFYSLPNIQNFLLPPSEHSTNDGQILFEECEDEVFIGIQFAQHIYSSTNKKLSAHEVTVIAEELSHFKFLADVIDKETQTNLLTIETLGEIDRFLCLMHWNNFESQNSKLNMEWKNIHQICDFVFTGDRFHGENKTLYIEAENLAFKHLKEAFAENWDNSYVNFTNISQSAKAYLDKLRSQFLTHGSFHV